MLLVLLVLAGCEKEEITAYRAPKDELPPVASPDRSLRLLAAIVPSAERLWFFKVTGPSDEVERLKPDFKAFVAKVRFEGDRPVWELPNGWRQEAGSELRYATIRIGGLELLVSRLGPEAAKLLENVNRWRGQLGLPPVDEARLPRYVSTIQRPEGHAILVELVAPEPEDAPKPRLSYQVPPTWREIAATGMRAAAFEIVEQGQRAEVTVISAGGSLLDNVNRWRGQVGLAAISQDELDRLVRPIEVDGTTATSVDLQGPQQRILGVILLRSGETWFIKMQGPVELVEREKAAFESFVRSVKFNG